MSARLVISAGLSLAVVMLVLFAIFTLNSFRSMAGEMKNATAIERVTPTPASAIPNGLEDVNAYRASKGLGPVELDARLNVSAKAKAADLVSHNYWAHYRDGKTPWDFIDAAGYDYHAAGENLARCFSYQTDIVDAWIASPAHEEVLTGNYQHVGFGIEKSSDGCEYVVAHFGSRS